VASQVGGTGEAGFHSGTGVERPELRPEHDAERRARDDAEGVAHDGREDVMVGAAVGVGHALILVAARSDGNHLLGAHRAQHVAERNPASPVIRWALVQIGVTVVELGMEKKPPRPTEEEMLADAQRTLEKIARFVDGIWRGSPGDRPSRRRHGDGLIMPDGRLDEDIPFRNTAAWPLRRASGWRNSSIG
jgi:hypothetical protein